MPEDVEIMRAWLRAEGEEVPERGRIRKELRDKYAAAHDDPGEDDAGPTGADLDPGPEPGPDMAEQVPRAPARAQRPRSPAAAAGKSAASRARELWGKARDAGKPAKGQKKRPWISTASVIEHAWSQLAWAARPLPPMQRIFAAQAPMAGVMLEEAARDTFIDRVLLQPAARAEDRLQAANAMLGPPLWTFAICSIGGAKQDPATGRPMVDETGMYVWDDRTQAMVAGLRFSLMSWLKVGGKRVDEITAEAEKLADLGDQADELIRWILAPNVPGQTPKEAERQAQAMGQAFIAGQAAAAAPGPVHRGVPAAAAVSQDDMTAHLEGMAAGSALRPAPAGKP